MGFRGVRAARRGAAGAAHVPAAGEGFGARRAARGAEAHRALGLQRLATRRHRLFYALNRGVPLPGVTRTV